MQRCHVSGHVKKFCPKRRHDSNFPMVFVAHNALVLGIFWHFPSCFYK